jgi:hypothetical protein
MAALWTAFSAVDIDDCVFFVAHFAFGRLD